MRCADQRRVDRRAGVSRYPAAVRGRGVYRGARQGIAAMANEGDALIRRESGVRSACQPPGCTICVYTYGGMAVCVDTHRVGPRDSARKSTPPVYRVGHASVIASFLPTDMSSGSTPLRPVVRGRIRATSPAGRTAATRRFRPHRRLKSGRTRGWWLGIAVSTVVVRRRQSPVSLRGHIPFARLDGPFA